MAIFSSTPRDPEVNQMRRRTDHTTLSIICDVRDPITKKAYSRDPRSVGRKTVEYLHKSLRASVSQREVGLDT